MPESAEQTPGFHPWTATVQDRRDTDFSQRETWKQTGGQETQAWFLLAGFAGLKGFKHSFLRFFLSLHKADVTVKEGGSALGFPS